MRRFAVSCFLGAVLMAPIGGLAAAPLCVDVLSPPVSVEDFFSTEVLRPYTGGLDSKRLERAGYAIINRFLIDTKTNTQLGSIKVLNPKYLFQWADADFQKDVLKNNGIFKEWMDELLAQLPQAAGRGFYVSTNPLDSVGFGDSLSIFKVDKPMYVLKMMPAKLALISSEVKKTKTLASLGIDAVTYEGYRASWFSIISNRHLQSVEKVFPTDSIRESMNDYLSPEKTFQYLASTQLPLILNFLKKQDPEFPADALSQWVDNGSHLEDIAPFFRTKSDALKILASALYYNRFYHERTGSVKQTVFLPSEMFSYLLEGVKNKSKSETIMLVKFWSRLTPEQQAQVPLSPEILYLRDLTKTLEGL